jgi:hypothetical protein
VCCASAGAERCGGVLCADPAYVVIPQAKKKNLKVTTSAFGCTVSLLLRRDPESFSVAERREGAR